MLYVWIVIIDWHMNNRVLIKYGKSAIKHQMRSGDLLDWKLKHLLGFTLDATMCLECVSLVNSADTSLVVQFIDGRIEPERLTNRAVYHLLTRDTRSQYLSMLTESERKEIKQKFMAIDTGMASAWFTVYMFNRLYITIDGDGLITPTEIAAYYGGLSLTREDYLHKIYKDDDKRLQEKLEKVRRANDALVSIFKEQDTDNSGTIEFEEFLLTEAHALYSRVGRRARADSDPIDEEGQQPMEQIVEEETKTTSPIAATSSPPSATTHFPAIGNGHNTNTSNNSPNNGPPVPSLLSSPLDDPRIRSRTLSPYSSANDSNAGSTGPSSPNGPIMRTPSNATNASSSNGRGHHSNGSNSSMASMGSLYNMPRLNGTNSNGTTNGRTSFGTTLPSLDDIVLAGAPPHAGANRRIIV
jgi:hypothetical protein